MAHCAAQCKSFWKNHRLQPDGMMISRIQPHVDKLVATMSNIIVSASTSGKMTTHLFLLWLINTFFPHAAARCLPLLDSWPTFRNTLVTDEIFEEGLDVEFEIIPPKTTSRIQSLNVFGFPMRKHFVRKFSDWATGSQSHQSPSATTITSFSCSP